MQKENFEEKQLEAAVKKENIINFENGHLHLESSNPTIQKFIEEHPNVAASIAVPVATVTVVGAVGVAVGAAAVAAAVAVVAVPVALVTAPIVKACGGDVEITKHGIIYGSKSKKLASEMEAKIIEVNEKV
ncbi:hypothetical protein HDV01_007064 [Terramyces sp. JEL0728]|nr:hypothetical protein HDV01_007064 [Terramyces sp. JEL0728]